MYGNKNLRNTIDVVAECRLLVVTGYLGRKYNYIFKAVYFGC